MSGNVVDAQRVDVVNSGAKGGNVHKVGGTSLKLEWQFGKCCFLKRHVAYHFATTLVGNHAVEQVFFTIKHTHSGRTVHLVAREAIEVGIKVLHVDLEVWSSLCTVD